MRQTQRQAQTQKLALTQTMRNSLALLEMGPDEAIRVISRERRRNAFLVAIPTGAPGGGSPAYDLDGPSQETALDDIGKQIGLIRLTRQESELAIGLLHSLDDRGFLADSFDDMAGYLGVSVNDIARLVPLLQEHVDPPGLFATSLAECFRLQLEAKNRFDPLIETLLGRLDLVAKQDVPNICALCGVDEEDAIDMLKDIRSLDPAPLVDKQDVGHVQGAPEIIIRTGADGGLQAELNQDALPSILTDDGLFSTTLNTETDGNAQSYYRDCYRSAANMVRAMQKRANTLLATGNAIAQRQEKFIKSGRSRNKLPLTVEQLASEVGVHKSTISRALRSCRIMTDIGTFPAKEFLALGLASDQAAGKTREQALQRLSLLIMTEDQKRPSSDDQLMRQLETAGFKLSRRTVAKYRKMLAIPGAHARKVL
ncbi:RNA polymerase sigma-54 factor [Ruegeria pomeroyi]|nr:RNA polymerase sigma-54 factor [Ruegeria pomeroyi]